MTPDVERWRAELERVKLAALAEFAAGAGHEMNNPLAVIVGRAELLLADEAEPRRRQDLQVIRAQARRVHEMIADLMLFARPPEPRCERCDLNELATRAAVAVAEVAEERQVELVRERSGPTPVEVDPSLVVLALRALMMNAIEASPGGERVEIGVADDGAAAAVRIDDRGRGLTATEREHAFEPFYSGRSAGRGLGVGLSKAWRIAELHRGAVVLENRAGGGARAVLRLPRAGR
jgi:hypothetical protein